MSDKCKVCDCTMAQRAVGDGCAICNPEKALDYALETIEDLEDENARLVDTVQDLVATFAYTSPDERLSSMAMPSLADAMRILSEYGRMTIELGNNRLVWGRMVNQEAADE